MSDPFDQLITLYQRLLASGVVTRRQMIVYLRQWADALEREED